MSPPSPTQLLKHLLILLFNILFSWKQSPPNMKRTIFWWSYLIHHLNNQKTHAWLLLIIHLRPKKYYCGSMRWIITGNVQSINMTWELERWEHLKNTLLWIFMKAIKWKSKIKLTCLNWSYPFPIALQKRRYILYLRFLTIRKMSQVLTTKCLELLVI